MSIAIVFINDNFSVFFITIQVIMNIFYNVLMGFGIFDEFDLGAPL